jgi:hypothetical protein
VMLQLSAGQALTLGPLRLHRRRLPNGGRRGRDS